MSIFSRTDKPSATVGIELGSSAIKMVELRHGLGRPKLITYGIGEHGRGTIQHDAAQNTEGLIRIIREIADRARITSTRVVAALPAMNVFHAVIELPKMPTKEIGSAIIWEAKRIVPMPIEKMSLDWHILSGSDPSAKTNQIIITAAPRNLVSSYLNIFRRANLVLVGIETEVNALQRALLPDRAGTFMVIDIGAANTNMVIFSDHIPVLIRNVNLGGDTFSAAIVNAMNINKERADQFLTDVGLPDVPLRQAGLPLDHATHPAAQAAKFILDTLALPEAQRLVNAAAAMHLPALEQIVITGGCALIKNFPQYIGRALRLPASLGDPWNKIDYPAELKPTLDKIGPQLAVAIGLALKL